MFKVMIVDDMEILRRDVKRLKLWGEDSGFIIAEEAVDGLNALKKLEVNDIDLLITDIRMPNMDGIELLSVVSDKKLCPVTVLLSDFTEYSYAKQGFQYGAFDYLSKPVDDRELSKLLKRIKIYLNEKKSQEQKLQALQGIVEKNSFIIDDTKQVIALIQSGDHQKAALLLSSLIDKIYVLYDSDRFRIPLAVQNTMHEIIDEILNSYSWMERFIDTDALKTADYFGCSDNCGEMKKMAKDVLEKLGTFINRFACCNDNRIVRQACEYTLSCIDEEISVKILSEKLFVNKSYLSETFKQKFGITLLEYITTVKVERAKRLLQEGNLKHYQIAEILGYKDVDYFSRLFKKYAGVPFKDRNV